MTSFLFWNVMHHHLDALIVSAVFERDVDILLIAESGISDGDLQTAIKTATGWDYAALSDPPDKVRVFTRLNTGH